MNHYVGIDVSLEASSVCVVDANGKIVCEGKIVGESEALIAWLTGRWPRRRRALLTARRLVQVKLHDIEMSLRGILLASTSRSGQPRQRASKGGFANSLPGIRAWGRSRSVGLRREFGFAKQRAMARCDTRARLLMSMPSVGPIVSLSFAAGD
jgi:hypothetical protein